MSTMIYDSRSQHLAESLTCLLRKKIVPADAAKILFHLPSRRLLDLDPLLRPGYGRLHSHECHSLTWAWPDQRGVENLAAVHFVDGCSADGHRRERALRCITSADTPLPLALALIRCDDWAGPVRSAADDALARLLGDDPSALFAHIGLIARLHGRERFLREVWTQRIRPVLTAPEHAQARRRALAAREASGRERLFVAELSRDCEPDWLEQTAEIALQIRDPALLRWVLRAAADHPDATLADAWLARALAYPSASIRVHALRVCAARVDAMPEGATETAQARAALADRIRHHLLDSYTSLRTFAAFHAPRFGIDALAHWRRSLDTDDDGCQDTRDGAPRHALLALCERGTAEDLPRLLRHTGHTSSRVRMAVRAGLARLDGEAARPHVLDGLRSAWPGEVRHALRIGRDLPRFMCAATLSSAWRDAANDDARRLLANAMHLLWPWDGLDALLDALENASTSVDCASILEALDTWRPAMIGRLETTRRDALLSRIAALRRGTDYVDWQRIARVLAEA